MHGLLQNVARHAELILNGARAQLDTRTFLQRIVLTAIVIGVEELFEPLQELEIVLETAFDQFIHRNDLEAVCWHLTRKQNKKKKK